MSTDDLLAALNLSKPNPFDAKADGDLLADVGLNATAQAKAIPTSPTALKMDKWSVRHGKEWLENSTQAQQLFQNDFDSGVIPEATELAAADFMAAAFEPEPALAEGGCQDETRGSFVSELLATPQYHALHASTVLDEAASELAAYGFAKSYVDLVEREREREERDGKGGDGDMPKELAAAIAAGKAVDEAKAEVSDLADARRAMDSMGGDGGGTNSPLAGKVLLEKFQRIKNNPVLRKIMMLAGRYRRAAQALQRQKCMHGRDDCVGVELDNDLGRILPAELVTLDDPDLELDTLRRFVERSLMCRQYQGVEKKAKGPVVVTVDESGSMSGEKVENAKALALAMVWIAHHEGRYACLVGYSGGDPPNALVLPPRKPLPDELMAWLEHFYSCGSNLDVPVKEIPEIWDSFGCPKGKTDLISITDEICHVPTKLANAFRAWKEREKVTYYVLTIGGHGEHGLAEIADSTTNVPELSPDAEAVQAVMSI